MDNQHKLIAGYRDLSEAEIASINEVKAKAAEVGELVEKLQGPASYGRELDRRWISIGATHLQQGFMALVRGIARPDGF